MNSRELVYKTLNFENPERAPRQLWELPWAEYNQPLQLERIKKDFSSDIVWISGYSKKIPKTIGKQFEIGEFVDEWGCRFTNRQRGVIGEVKEPLIQGEEWEDRNKLRIPFELLDIEKGRINSFCNSIEKSI